MAGKAYKKGKRGSGRHVQLTEAMQASEAWATLKPGPRALYIELKRRYRGHNNGNLVLSHRDAAAALNVNRNTVGPWFAELERRGLIHMTRGASLGPSGIGQSALWALSEAATADGKPATATFRTWREKQNPVPKSGPPRPSERDSSGKSRDEDAPPVLKIVTGG